MDKKNSFDSRVVHCTMYSSGEDNACLATRVPNLLLLHLHLLLPSHLLLHEIPICGCSKHIEKNHVVLFTCGMPIRSKVYPGELQTFSNICFGMFDESLKDLQFAEVANISKRLYSLYCGDGRGKNSRPAHAALGEPERVLANSKNPTLLSVPFFRDTTIWDTTILSNSKKDYREPELVLSSSKNPTLS